VRRFAVIAAWLVAPALFAITVAVTGPANLLGDFRAFYCAGDAVAHGANPYLEQPLHACEQRAQPPRVPAWLRDTTVPAPLPPPALLAFAPFARLPFPIAGALFEALAVAAMCGAVLLFSRTVGVSTTLLNLAFAGVTATQTYLLGQPVPFVLLALAGAALFARREQWIAAAACIAACVAEPAIALPVALATFVLLPRMRLPLLGAGVLLALASAGAVGWATSVAYVRVVIPAHAIANAYEWQFSLTSILTSAGMAAGAAVRYGEVMYAVMTIAGVAVAARVWRAGGDRAALVLLPPAFAAFGGVHVHAQQIVVALPAILYVYARYPRVRALAATGATFAMIPWNFLAASVLTGVTPLLVGWFARLTLGARRGLVLTGISALISLSLLALVLAGFGPGVTPFVPHAYPPDALAEASWADFSRAELARTSLVMQWLRVPVLGGLALGLAAIVRAAFQ
jgi:hypothetical protein